MPMKFEPTFSKRYHIEAISADGKQTRTRDLYMMNDIPKWAMDEVKWPTMTITRIRSQTIKYQRVNGEVLVDETSKKEVEQA